MTAAGVPLLIDLDGRPVIVIGAGPVAAAKLRSLGDARADITVVAPEAVPTIHDLAETGALRWERRAYAHGDCAGALLVVAATSVTAVNDAVAAEADAQGTLCVRVDAPASSASFMGAVRRGPLTIAVASGVPALSGRLRAELAAAYGEEHGVLAALLGELRTDEEVIALLAPHDDASRASLWRQVLDTDILELLRTGRIDLAKEVALACLSSSTD